MFMEGGKGVGRGRRTSEDDFLLAELVEMRLEICVREGAGLCFMYHLRARIRLHASSLSLKLSTEYNQRQERK